MITKSQANYRPAVNQDHQCRNCSMFRSKRYENGKCTLVEGIIEGDYVCDHWAARGEAKAA